MEASMPPPEETLLIVDDEPLMTDVFRQFMTKRNFRVLTAASGEEALRIVAEADRVDLIITDMTMPDMDGATLARRLYEKLPDVPVMIASGHDLDPLTMGVTPNVVEVVRKPYQNRRLAERIREILDARG
jgi:two-component system cell cycle sensor histidine kinase/response regulator CckA